MFTRFQNKYKEENIIKEELKLFKKYNQDQSNKGRQNAYMVQECLQVLKEKYSTSRLLDFINILREYKEGQRPCKYVRKLSYKHKDYDPRVDLEIHGVFINHVVIEFGSQVNILP
jgi:hypothetical protein